MNNQLGFNFDEVEDLETVEERKTKEKEAKEAAKKEAEEKKRLETELLNERQLLKNKLLELNKFDFEKEDGKDVAGSVEELLKEVDKMPFEEIKAVNKGISPAYLKMSDIKKNQEKEKQEIARKKAEEAAKPKTYKYPFIVHMAGNNIETDHIFENEKDYTTEEIRTKMLEHQYYDFSGKVEFEYLEKENILLPIFQHHRKG